MRPGERQRRATPAHSLRTFPSGLLKSSRCCARPAAANSANSARTPEDLDPHLPSPLRVRFGSRRVSVMPSRYTIFKLVVHFDPDCENPWVGAVISCGACSRRAGRWSLACAEPMDVETSRSFVVYKPRYRFSFRTPLPW